MGSSLRSRRVPRAVRRNRFLYYLFYERAFLIAMLAFVVVGLGAAIFLPRIWIVTPRNFSPEVKVRGLDFIQASSLRRAAVQATESGAFKEAMLSWRGAVENNPGDPTTIRAALTNVTRLVPPAREWLGWGVFYGNWLLRLSHTNHSDVALVARVYEHYEFDEMVIRLLSPNTATLRGDQAAPYLRALFRLGRLDRFAEVWKQFESSLREDPEMQVYYAAYLSGWGPSQTSMEARRRLDDARNEPTTSQLGNRLTLAVCAARNELEVYKSCLNQLEATEVDRPRDHVQYWRLLALNQRADEARDLARRFVRPPATPMDAEAMTRGLVELGMREDALNFLQRYRDQFDYSTTLWVLQSRLLIETERWDDLRSLAVNLRQRERLVQALGGYSYFLSGLADLHQGRPEKSEEAFRQLSVLPIPDPVLGYTCATALAKLGHTDIATTMLGRVENIFGNQLDFWLQLQAAAYDSRQFDQLLIATQKAYKIAPDRLEYLNNYAAALLVSRNHAAEAIELTLQALNRAPKAFETRLNHALALLQNTRLNDAEPLLRDLDDERRDSEHDTLVSLAWFDYHLQRGDITNARLAHARIQPRYLLQPQADWVATSIRKLGTTAP